MGYEPGHHGLRVVDVYPAAWPCQHAGVSDLSAAFGIERGFQQDHVDACAISDVVDYPVL